MKITKSQLILFSSLVLDIKQMQWNCSDILSESDYYSQSYHSCKSDFFL